MFFFLQAMMHKQAISDISTRATNEATLEQMLNKVVELWGATEFRLVPHPQQGIMMLAGADDILTQLEECQVTIGQSWNHYYYRSSRIKLMNGIPGKIRNLSV